MAVDQNQPGRRQHYNRGRRGPDRRGSDRRTAVTQETPARGTDQVDVEQIMRDVRARIAQRSGIELSTQQIQELAARRLEAILDPRAVSPSLLQQLQRGAAAAPDVPAPSMEPPYSFEAETLYESHRGLLRVIRRLLNPLLKLFFNPTPIVHALHTQARLNREAAAREAERERIQREWNALHYEILQHLVTDVSRVSVEMQALMLRVEALAARIDFADRRVRTLEAGAPAGTPRAARPAEASPAAAPSQAAATTTAAATSAVTATAAETAGTDAAGTDAATAEGSRRRRRRRRGRRGGAGTDAAATIVVGGSEGLTGPDAADLTDADEGDEEEAGAPAVPAAPEAPDADPLESPFLRPETGGGQSADAPPDDAPTSMTSAGETEPHFPVREGLAQGAPPPPQPPEAEPGPAPAWPPEPEASAVESAPAGARSEPDVSTAAPPPPAPVPTPPPDEPTPQPEPRDPGPTDR